MKASFHQPVVCPVLIGRTPDLALLQLSLEQVKSGKGQVALLCGEAGIGKSRLVAELKNEAFAQGFQLLQGNCFPTDRSFPYAPLLDLLRSIFLTSFTAQIESLSPLRGEGKAAHGERPLQAGRVPVRSWWPHAEGREVRRSG